MSNRRKKRRQKRTASIALIIVALVLVAGVGIYFLHGQKDEGSDNSQSVISNITENVSNSDIGTASNSISSNAQSSGDIYEDFMKGSATLNFSYYFSAESLAINENSNDYDLFSNLSKKEYTLPDLVDEMNSIFTDPNGFYCGDKISKMEYSYLDCGNDGNKELALRFTCPIVEQQSTMTMIVKEMDGKLQLIHSFDEWSRCSASLNEYGFVSSGGSGGAAVHSFETGYIDASGKYNFGYSEIDYSDVDAFGMEYDNTGYDLNSISGILELFTLRTKPTTMDDYKPQYFACAIEDNGNDTEELYKSGPYKSILDSFTGINFMKYDEMLKLENQRNEEIGATSEIINGKELEYTEFKL